MKNASGCDAHAAKGNSHTERTSEARSVEKSLTDVYKG